MNTDLFEQAAIDMSRCQQVLYLRLPRNTGSFALAQDEGRVAQPFLIPRLLVPDRKMQLVAKRDLLTEFLGLANPDPLV